MPVNPDPFEQGGLVGEFSSQEERLLVLAPATAGQVNRVRDFLRPLACWRLDDPQFDVDSSIIRHQAAKEFKALSKLRRAFIGSPLALFGHADPVGQDAYNKELSGRRARAVYGLLTRDTRIWEELYATKVQGVGDAWKYKAIQIMLAGLGFNPRSSSGSLDDPTINAVKAFQRQQGLAADGDPGPSTRKKLFPAYMEAICRDGFDKPFRLQKSDFLARGVAADGKGDYQGCGEFNPVLMFSQKESNDLSDPARKTERGAKNAPNRRVVALLFRPGEQVTPNKWPCPAATDSAQGCTRRFWSDAAQRRQFQENRRTHEADRDTFACRFYQRLTNQSPCEGAIPIPLGLVRVTPRVFAREGNVVAVAERVDGKSFPEVNRMSLGSLSLKDDEVWVSESGLLYFVPPAGADEDFFEMSLPDTGQVFTLDHRVSYAKDQLESVKSLVNQMTVLRDAATLRHAEGMDREEQSDDLRLRYDVIVVEGHRRLEAALNAITESGNPVASQEDIVASLEQLNGHGRALDVFASATFPPQDTALA